MSWIGKIARTERKGDSLDVIIHYVDDQEREYDQTISTTITQSDNWLQDQINIKLKQLNELDSFEQNINKTAVETSFSIDEVGGLVKAEPMDIKLQ